MSRSHGWFIQRGVVAFLGFGRRDVADRLQWPAKQAQVLTEKDTKRVLANIARKPFAARNRCMLQLSWLSGMRVGEIAALCVRDVVNDEAMYASKSS